MTRLTGIGIIDIGSNSIRLVIYERTTNGAHRVVSEYKESARLSGRIDANGILHKDDILSIVPILSHFTLLCKVHSVDIVRAVATAAIRNAANSREIINWLQEETGLIIEELSGYDEARLGFLGVVNTLDVQDGFIVDIGGGSTEVTLFRGRKMAESVSFPIGAVNTAKLFKINGIVTAEDLAAIRAIVEQLLAEHPWIRSHPGLPLIGLGGSVRSLAKMSQKHLKYTLPIMHNYVIKGEELAYFLGLLPSMPLEKRKKIDGLSKDRADIIVPGLVILQAIYDAAQADPIIVSGSGLRDGLLYETIRPTKPQVENVLESSIYNLLHLHPNGAENHVKQVNKLALDLFDQLSDVHAWDHRERIYLYTAALTYRIGVSINYYQFSKHTEYMLTQSRIDGLSHRETVICALIASYKTKSRCRQKVLAHKDILTESDEETIIRLGTLLQAAIALDKSETQPVQSLTVMSMNKELRLGLTVKRYPFVEIKEIDSLQKEFHKVFGCTLTYEIEDSSMK